MNERPMPLVQPPDLAGLPPVYEFLAARAVEALASDGELHPALLVLSVPPGANEPVATSVMDPNLVHALQRDATRKEALMALVRSLLSAEHPMNHSVAAVMGAHPNLVAHISESWVVSQPVEAGRQSLAVFEGSLEHHPRRTEAITITLHCLRGTFIGLCPMTRDDAGRATATVQPLNMRPEDWRGRFNVHSASMELGAVEVVAAAEHAGPGERLQ
jgi:hypothetical protein